MKVDPHEEHHPVNVALSLLRMISANIENHNFGLAAQLADAAREQLQGLLRERDA